MAESKLNENLKKLQVPLDIALCSICDYVYRQLLMMGNRKEEKGRLLILPLTLFLLNF